MNLSTLAMCEICILLSVVNLTFSITANRSFFFLHISFMTYCHIFRVFKDLWWCTVVAPTSVKQHFEHLFVSCCARVSAHLAVPTQCHVLKVVDLPSLPHAPLWSRPVSSGFSYRSAASAPVTPNNINSCHKTHYI